MNIINKIVLLRFIIIIILILKKMNRRKFLSYVGCGCGSMILGSCASAPIV